MAENFHEKIDARPLRLTEAVVLRLDAEPHPRAKLAENVSRWSDSRLRVQWEHRLARPWRALAHANRRGRGVAPGRDLGSLQRIIRDFWKVAPGRLIDEIAQISSIGVSRHSRYCLLSGRNTDLQ
jgi:hypothetical protein